MHKIILYFIISQLLFICAACDSPDEAVKCNPKDDGYRGIWHADLESDDEYRYIYYSGGLGTSTAKHIPLAYYAEDADKTLPRDLNGQVMGAVCRFGQHQHQYQRYSFYDLLCGECGRHCQHVPCRGIFSIRSRESALLRRFIGTRSVRRLPPPKKIAGGI